MGLTAAEQAELNQLQQVVPSQPQGNLSPDEQKEMAQLRAIVTPDSAADPNSYGPLDSFVSGGEQGGTAGFADEASGLLAAAKAKIQGDKTPFTQLYQKGRDASRAEYGAAEQAHPYFYTAGQLGGGLLTALIPGLGEMNAGEAAALGAVNALGSNNADLTKGQVAPAAAAMAIGAGGGVFGNEAGKVVGGYLQNAAKEGALTAAIRHLRPTPNLARAIGPDAVKAAAQEALHSGAIQVGEKSSSTVEKLTDLLDQIGQAKGDLVDEASQQGKIIRPDAIAADYQKNTIDPLIEQSPTENAAAIRKAEAIKNGFLNHYFPEGQSMELMTPTQVENAKIAANSNINWNNPNLTNAKIGVAKGWQNTLKRSVEDVINDPTFNRTKEAYQNLVNAAAMANRTSTLTDGGGGLMAHLTDLSLAPEILRETMAGNPAGLGVAAARQLTKGRMASSIAASLNNLAKSGLLTGPVIPRAFTNNAGQQLGGLLNRSNLQRPNP